MLRRIMLILIPIAVPLSLIAISMPPTAAQGTSTAAVSPAAGPASSTVTGSGTNWQPGDHIQAEWGDDNSNLGSPVVVASNGTFTDPNLTIPSNATLGSHQILFWDEDSRYFVAANFDVTQPTPPPTNFKVTAVSPLTMLLTWAYQGNQNPVSAFEVTNGVVSGYASSAARSDYWVHLNPGEYMCFRIRADSSAGDSVWVPTQSPYYVCATTPTTSTDMRLCNGYTACGTNGYTTHGYQSHSSTSYWNMDTGDECTNYAAYVESAVYKVPKPTYNLGNANTWAKNAHAHGVKVDHTPSVGAVAQWNGPTSGHPEKGISSAGHVAVVEQVGPNNSYIVISQQDISSDTNGYDWQIIYAGVPSTQYEPWPDNFIHF